MKRRLLVLAVIAALAVPCSGVHAADTGPIFTAPLLGISLGSMAGFLASLSTSEPQDHTHYVGIGAVIGLGIGLALAVAGMKQTSAGFYRKGSGDDRVYGFAVTIGIR